MPNKLISQEKFANHMLLLFYSFRDEKELLSDCPLLYQSKLQEQRIQEVANMNKIMFKPYSDLVDQTFSHFNETLINIQDLYNKIQNYKTPRAEYNNGNNSEGTETNKTSAIFNVMPKIIAGDGIEEEFKSNKSLQLGSYMG